MRKVDWNDLKTVWASKLKFTTHYIDEKMQKTDGVKS